MSRDVRTTFRQLSYLIRQEIKSALRSKYIFLSFIVLPIFIWLIQGLIPVFIIGVFSGASVEDFNPVTLESLFSTL